jgi:hypothetical protein
MKAFAVPHTIIVLHRRQVRLTVLVLGGRASCGAGGGCAALCRRTILARPSFDIDILPDCGEERGNLARRWINLTEFILIPSEPVVA